MHPVQRIVYSDGVGLMVSSGGDYCRVSASFSAVHCAFLPVRWFARSRLIETDNACEMPAEENSGFSHDAAVHVGAHDRAGIGRLLSSWLGPLCPVY